nr:hypothetical protein [Candidatus Sigynarchaeota archaeon]
MQHNKFVKSYVWMGFVAVLITISCLAFTTNRECATDGMDPALLNGTLHESATTDDYVDVFLTDGYGTTTSFNNMRDTNTATYATLAYENVAGTWRIDQIYQFTGLSGTYNNYEVCVYVYSVSGSCDVYTGNSNPPTDFWYTLGALAGLTGAEPVTDPSGSSYYIEFYDSAASDPGPLYISSIFLRLTDTAAPTWTSANMPAENQWYTSRASCQMHVTFQDNVLLMGGYQAANRDALSTDTIIWAGPSGTLYDRPTWNMATTVWNSCPQGNNYISFLVVDSLGNYGGTSGAWHWHFNKDDQAPAQITTVTSSTHSIDTWSSNYMVTIDSWNTPSDNGGSGVAGYCTTWTHGAQDITSPVNNCTGAPVSRILGDGSDWYINIKAVDAMGFWSAVKSYGPFKIDSNAPSMPSRTGCTHTDNAWSTNNQVTISWSCSDGSGSGIAGYRATWTEGSAVDPGTSGTNTASTSAQSPVLADGNWYFNIRSCDNMGFWSAHRNYGPFKIDTTAPAQAAPTCSTHTASTWSNDTSITVTWTDPGDGSGSGVTGYSITWSNNSAATPDVISDTAGLSSTNSPGEGQWFFNIRSVDALGHASTTTSIGPFFVDTAAPGILGLACTNHVESTWSTNNTIVIQWTMTDHSGSGVLGYSFSWSNASSAVPDRAVDAMNDSITANLPDGLWYFNIQASDVLHHWSSTTSLGPYWIDRSAPVVSMPNSSTHVVGSWTETMAINITWTGTDHGGSGIQGYSFSWSMGAGTNPGTTITTAELQNTTSLSDGQWYFNVRACDDLDQWSMTISAGPFDIDTALPSIAGSSAFNVTWPATGQTVNWTLSDANPATYTVLMNGSAVNSSIAWTSGNLISISLDDLEPGVYNFTVIATDQAGKDASHS